MPVPFLSVLPPLTPTLQFLCLSCSALNLDSSLQLITVIPRSSAKRFLRMSMALCWLSSLIMSLGYLYPPLCPSAFLSPPVLKTAIVGMFFPLWDMALCFILHTALLGYSSSAASFHLPFFRVYMSPTFWLLVLFHPLQPSYERQKQDSRGLFPSVISYSPLALV